MERAFCSSDSAAQGNMCEAPESRLSADRRGEMSISSSSSSLEGSEEAGREVSVRGTLEAEVA